MNSNKEVRPAVKAYSIIKQCPQEIKRQKRSYRYVGRPDEYGFKIQNEYLKDQYIRIGSLLANSRISELDLKIYCLHQGGWGEEFGEKDITEENVKKISNRYNFSEYDKTKNIILGLKEKLGYESEEEFFRLNYDGFTSAIHLIEMEIISPVYWLINGHMFEKISHPYEEVRFHQKIRTGLFLIKREIMKKED